MRADRLLSIVLLLQAHQRLTSRSLAERLEVSERTIHRDMEALSGAGIPVVAERGSTGGWSLLGNYRTDLSGLNESEIQSLFLTPPPKLLSDLKLQKASEGALLKLLAALPAMYRRGAERARQRIYVDSGGWSRHEEPVPWLSVVQDALWGERRLRITYERGPGCEPVVREVDPLGLVAKGSAWYLVAGVAELSTVPGAQRAAASSSNASTAERMSVRSYRVSKIVAAEILEGPVTMPAHFELGDYWRKSEASFKAALPNYVATFRVAPAVFPRLRFAGRFARVGNVLATDDEGWLRVTVGFDVEEMACEYALGFGSNLEVLEPPSLRVMVSEAAQRVVDLYLGVQSSQPQDFRSGGATGL